MVVKTVAEYCIDRTDLQEYRGVGGDEDIYSVYLTPLDSNLGKVRIAMPYEQVKNLQTGDVVKLTFEASQLKQKEKNT